MKDTLEEITFEEFLEHYEPDLDQDGDLVEYEYVEENGELLRKAQNERRLWTIIEGDSDDVTYIGSGVWMTNRLGYLITRVPCEEGRTISIRLEG